jgi:hypothetical protein
LYGGRGIGGVGCGEALMVVVVEVGGGGGCARVQVSVTCDVSGHDNE